MAEHERILVNDKLPGAIFVLPPCPPDTDAVYEADGWHDAPEGTQAPDVLAEAFAEGEAAQHAAAEAAPDAPPAFDPNSQNATTSLTAPESVDPATGTGEQTDQHQEP